MSDKLEKLLAELALLSESQREAVIEKWIKAFDEVVNVDSLIILEVYQPFMDLNLANRLKYKGRIVTLGELKAHYLVTPFASYIKRIGPQRWADCVKMLKHYYPDLPSA